MLEYGLNAPKAPARKKTAFSWAPCVPATSSTAGGGIFDGALACHAVGELDTGTNY
ncbi:hypothetical protein ACFS07_14840 [Undibacterium arcticum]